MSVIEVEANTYGSHPPLWAEGNLDLLTRKRVAVVGARACTAYGAHVAGQIGATLSHHDVVTVSGGAYGIDGAAHRGALSTERAASTIVVLPSGIDRAYPTPHHALFRQVAERGLLVTAYPPGTVSRWDRFLERNGHIVALSHALIAVEAGRRSGTLNAVRQAHEKWLPVFAIPGPVTSEASRGTNELLAEGKARAIADPTELGPVLAAIGELG